MILRNMFVYDKQEIYAGVQITKKNRIWQVEVDTTIKKQKITGYPWFRNKV